MTHFSPGAGVVQYSIHDILVSHFLSGHHESLNGPCTEKFFFNFLVAWIILLCQGDGDCPRDEDNVHQGQ